MNRLAFATVACLAVAGGCGPAPMIQTETTIRPDGSCDRIVWQPRDRLLPPDAFSPAWLARWRKVEEVAVPPAFAKENPGPGEPYFRAEGTFASPAEVPDHFLKVIDGHPDLGAAGMTREYRRRDFGLFVEHRWSETLAGGVEREGFEPAREQFLDRALPILTEGATRVYGGEYDVSAAIAEFERRGRPFLRDLINAWREALDAADGDPRTRNEATTRGFAAAIERAGVNLRDPAGNLVDGAEQGRRVRAFLADRITATFRRKDGSPPSPNDVRAIQGESNDAPHGQAWRDYGNDRKAEIEAVLLPPLARMTGPYFFPGVFAPPAPRFALDLRLPGQVLADETNGTTEASGMVSWRFDATRLYPSGFVMTAASIEFREDAQRRLLGRVAVGDLASARVVRDLLADDAETLDSLRNAVATGDPSQLVASPATAPDRKARIAQLRDLLGIAP